MAACPGSPWIVLSLNLGLQVARFAARLAVVLAVFTEADVVCRLAGTAVALAFASLFRQVAYRAHVFLSHGRRLARIPAGCKIPPVFCPCLLHRSFPGFRPDHRPWAIRPILLFPIPVTNWNSNLPLSPRKKIMSWIKSTACCSRDRSGACPKKKQLR